MIVARKKHRVGSAALRSPGMEWHPYLIRRLAERLANLWFVLQNLLR